MSLLGSLFGALFGKKQPQPKKKAPNKPTSTKKSSKSTRTAAKPASAANANTHRVMDAHPTVRYSIPKPPTPEQMVQQSRSAWYPPGRVAKLDGRSIPGGMLYVGSTLSSVSGRTPIDPALIDPAFPVARSQPDTLGKHLSYWPSYAELHPESRAAYLDWLESGRPAGAPIGYVFLFFYGIERRVLFDALHDQTARAEIPVLMQEVERLRRLYPDQRSFQGYSAEFLVAALLIKGSIDPREIDPPIPDSSWELPLSAKIALGTFAANQQPLPPIWALSWLCCDPETRLRTPATRCRQEFMTLFRLEYQRRYGAGMIIDPPKRRAQVQYRPASAGFSGPVALGDSHLPDVAVLRKPQHQLQEIANLVTTKLDEYSRALGAGRPGASPSALAYLPAELGDLSRFPAVAPIATILQQSLRGMDTGMVDVRALLDLFPELGPRPSQKQAEAVSQLVQRLGYGLEPDPAHHRRAFVDSSHAGLYILERQDETARRDLGRAIGMVTLSALVANADGRVSDDVSRRILDQVSQAFALRPAERRRLHAHLEWLGSHPATLASARARLGGLSSSQAAQTGRFLSTIAAFDGQITPAEVKLLTKLYAAMGLSDQQLHSDLHLVTFRPNQRPAKESTAGAADRNAGNVRATQAVALDADYIRLVQQQTAEISGVLDQVFASEDDHIASETSPDSISDERAAEQPDPYRQFMRMLAERPVWEAIEVSSMAQTLGLMAAGAIETINDRAVDLGLEPLLECDNERCDVYEPTLIELLTSA